MTVPERWEELGRVLLEPALQERKLAKDLHPHVRRGSSIDSAISEMSDTPRSSIISPTEVFPQYQISNIGQWSGNVSKVGRKGAGMVCVYKTSPEYCVTPVFPCL